MTILERLRGESRSIDINRFARSLRRDLPVVGSDDRNVVERLGDAAAGAAEDLARTAERMAGELARSMEQAGDKAARAADRAGKDARTFGRELGGTASEALGSAAAATSGTVAHVGDRAAKAGRELHLEGRVDDVVKRIRQELPTERLAHLVTNLERELPTTDKDRYDRAFHRGRARARTSFLGIGLVAGILGGIAGAFFLDPERGRHRREQAASRARKAARQLSREVRRRATWTSQRARGIAIERGLIEKPGDDGSDGRPESSGDREGTVMQATPRAVPRVPVMDPASIGAVAPPPVTTSGAGGTLAADRIEGVEPVMPVGSGPVTDPASLEREPLTTPAGGTIGGASSATPRVPEPAADQVAETSDDEALLSVNSNAVTSTLEPEAENATVTGEDADRGTWHRNV